jgi:SAM-dependent methyltransferase
MVDDPRAPAEPAGSWRQFQLAGNAPEGYERFLAPALFAPWSETVLDLVDLRPGQRVLDVACGTGIVTRRAVARVEPGGTVVGLDLNEGMLSVARSVAPEVTDWRTGRADELPFPDGAFDAVVCQQGLQFFPDRSAALREMHRVTATGGRLGLAVWRPIQHVPGFHLLVQTLQRRLGAEAAGMMRAPFAPGTAADWREQVESAGVTQVRVTIGVGAVRFPSSAAWLRSQAAGSPLSGPVAPSTRRRSRHWRPIWLRR